MEIEIGAVLETHDSQRPTFDTFGIFGIFKIRKKVPEFHTIIFVWA